MARESNFLLGYGERLANNVFVPIMGGPKNPPYSFENAKARMMTRIEVVNRYANDVPDEACPNGEITAILTMHPRYISKSDFPIQFLQQVGLRAVGGKSKLVTPEQWGTKKHPIEAISNELFVVGKRETYLRWQEEIRNLTKESKTSEFIQIIEDFSPFAESDKLPSEMKEGIRSLYEVVLHEGNDSKITEAFYRYCEICECQMVTEKKRIVKNLAFIPVYAEREQIKELAKFTLIRSIKNMPLIRTSLPIQRTAQVPEVEIPYSKPAVDENVRVAVFDGGIPPEIQLPWVKHIEVPGLGPVKIDAEKHGLEVTSALLFGPLDPDKEIIEPLCKVDHYRVLDSKTGADGDFMYYDVLDRILNILYSANPPYEFVNISVGPDVPIDDADITRWTAELDQFFAGGKSLATVAVGNMGQLNASLGLNRVQPPSDGVNVMSVGAANNESDTWEKADYSCVGPGRCPGYIKPDGVMFGGSDGNLFYTLCNYVSKGKYGISGTMGTSYAAPYALRTALFARVQMGNVLLPLAIKALLIHRANQNNLNQTDVGWGRFENDPERLVTCDDDESLVVFQGMLPVKEHLRIPIPIPANGLEGMITMTATMVIAPEVDTSFSNVYTKAGLTVAFRPHKQKFKKEKNGKVPLHPETKPFFNKESIFSSSEFSMIKDGHKWETCIRASKKMKSTDIDEPVFDVYYNSRSEGRADEETMPIPYAFIISVKAPSVPDLYSKTVRHYTNQLVPLKPQNTVKIRYKNV